MTNRRDVGPAVSVLVVDDQEAFRKTARELVADTPGFALAGEAESGESALQLVAAARPDIVLMDVRMPGIGGLEAARRIRAAHPGTVVVLLSTYARAEHAAAGEPSSPAIVSKGSLCSAFLRAVWETGAGPS